MSDGSRPFHAPPPAAAPRRARAEPSHDDEKFARTTTGMHSLERDTLFGKVSEWALADPPPTPSYAGSYAGTPPPTPPAGADRRQEGYIYGAPRGKRNATTLSMERSTPLPEPEILTETVAECSEALNAVVRRRNAKRSGRSGFQRGGETFATTFIETVESHWTTIYNS